MLRGRGREHEEPVGVQSRDRPVVLDPAALVEEQRVDQAADRHVHVVRADVLEEPERVRTRHLDLGERAQVEERDRLARRAMLLGCVREPVLSSERVLVDGFHAGRREPHRALPLRELAEARAGGQRVGRRAGSAGCRAPWSLGGSASASRTDVRGLPSCARGGSARSPGTTRSGGRRPQTRRTWALLRGSTRRARALHPASR